MGVAKLSVSLPDSLAGFVEAYRKKRGLKTRSQVFEEAVRLLRSRDLESAYRDSSREYDKAWDATAGDGLTDETWWNLLRRTGAHRRPRDQQETACTRRKLWRQQSRGIHDHCVADHLKRKQNLSLRSCPTPHG